MGRDIIMLDEQNSNPSKTQSPYPPCVFTFQEKVLAWLLLGLTKSTHSGVQQNPSPAQTHSCWNSAQQHPPGCKHYIRERLHLLEVLEHLFLGGALSDLAKHSYVDLTEKHPDSSLLHTWVSFTSFLTMTLEMWLPSSDTNKVFHSNLLLLQVKVHLHTESSHTPTSSTFWPWFNDSENNLGNKVFRLEFPTHTLIWFQ